MAKKVKKRVSNGISSLSGNKEVKEGHKHAHVGESSAPLEQKTIEGKSKKAEATTQGKSQEGAKLSSSPTAPLIITVSRHEYPALKSVIGSSAFYTVDGRELRNLLDMALAFEEMSEDTFRHHVGNGYNHFSNWLNDCFHLEHLAESIKSSDRKEAHTKVLRHLLHEVLK